MFIPRDVDKLLDQLLKYLDPETVSKIQSLSEEEKTVLKYFISNISVGVIASIKELKTLYGIQDPKSVIRKLIDLGLLEAGSGCYSLAQKLREALLKVYLGGKR